MLLRLERKIPPRRVAVAIQPDTPTEELRYDFENVYEWIYISVPPLEYPLNVSRKHGMSEVEDDLLDRMSAAEIENLQTAGPTYILAIDESGEHSRRDIPHEVVQRIANALGCDIAVLPERPSVDSEDPEPVAIVRPDT